MLCACVAIAASAPVNSDRNTKPPAGVAAADAAARGQRLDPAMAASTLAVAAVAGQSQLPLLLTLRHRNRQHCLPLLLRLRHQNRWNCWRHARCCLFGRARQPPDRQPSAGWPLRVWKLFWRYCAGVHSGRWLLCGGKRHDWAGAAEHISWPSGS
jgi:hypothetical protein